MSAPVDSALGKVRSHFRRWLTLNLLLVALVGSLSLTYPVEELSRRLGDFYFRLRGAQATSQQVALVLIDDASINRYGRWPWPRRLLAQLLRATVAQRPRALGLDILLPEPSDEEGDRELAQALEAAGNVVLAAKIAGSPEGPLWVQPLPLFADRAAGVAHVQAVLGPDGICRSVPVRELSTEGPRWAFALEVARVAQGVELQELPDGLYLGKTRVPVEGWTPRGDGAFPGRVFPQFLRVDYRRQILPGQSPPPFLSVAAKDLLEGKGGEALRGKAVLIGFAATELSDRLPTPVSAALPMPGVEIHANLVETLLEGRSLELLGIGLQVLLVIGASFFATWVMLRWPGAVGLLALVAFLAGGYAGGYFLFARAHCLIELGPFVCVGLLAAPLAQLENLAAADRGLTRALRQLQQTIEGAGPAMGAALRDVVGSEMPVAPRDLHWKIRLINQLQRELGALYTFDQTLLWTMQEGLAVFAPDGRLIFRNPAWLHFCQRLSWSPAGSLDEFVNSLDHHNWRDLGHKLVGTGAHVESELPLGGGLWQVKALRLPSTLQTGAGALMVVVADLTARLERDQARAEALGFVTHELRTPLVSIQGFAEFLLRYPQAAASNDAAATIFRESKRLVAMINTYLDVLRLEAGWRAARREVIDFEQTVSQAERVVQPLAQAAEITVKTAVDAGLPLLHGDPHLLTGALLNLLSNAVKYSPPASEITVRASSEAGDVVLEVRNAGPPIPAEDLAHLFEPYYRRREHEESAPGWGLGLAFVRRIAESHGGRVECLSDASGTSFRILLPSAPPPRPELSPGPRGGAAGSSLASLSRP